MRKVLGIWSILGSIVLVGVIVAGSVVLSSSPTVAARPKPDCGPSYVWDCKLPNGSHTIFGGTRCDMFAYQRQTGATCVPSGL